MLRHRITYRTVGFECVIRMHFQTHGQAVAFRGNIYALRVFIDASQRSFVCALVRFFVIGQRSRERSSELPG